MPYFSAPIYREDLIDIDLDNNGSLHRSFLNHAIGKMDDMANRFGVRLFRSGQPVNVEGCQCSGVFMAPNGQNIAISGNDVTGKSGNAIWIQLPDACYAVSGQFSLAIRVTSEYADVVSTMRIVDGVVNNTGADDVVVPVDRLPTTNDILEAFQAWQEAAIGSVRFDITQVIDEAGQARARSNIDSMQDIGLFIGNDGYIYQRVNVS